MHFIHPPAVHSGVPQWLPQQTTPKESNVGYLCLLLFLYHKAVKTSMKAKSQHKTAPLRCFPLKCQIYCPVFQYKVQYKTEFGIGYSVWDLIYRTSCYLSRRFCDLLTWPLWVSEDTQTSFYKLCDLVNFNFYVNPFFLFLLTLSTFLSSDNHVNNQLFQHCQH